MTGSQLVYLMRSRRMKRVLIHAYLAGNLGDDLLVRLLCERYPEVRFYILGDEMYKVRYSDLKNCRVSAQEDKRVRIINRFMKWFGIQDGFRYLLVKYATAVVHIGGSCFVQHFDDWSSFYKVDQDLAEKSRNLFLVGANFGPYTNEDYYRDYHELFKKYRGICLRDQYSRELFWDIPQISYAPDVVFQCKMRPWKEKKKKIVVSVIELENRGGKYSISGYAETYLGFHVQMIRYLIGQGYEISLVSFCQSQMDDSMIQKICDGLENEKKKKVTCIAYQTELSPILKEFEESEGVIGTRFHSIVLGLLNHCKVLPVVYDQKTERTLEDLHYPMKLELSELGEVSVRQTAEKFLNLKNYEISQVVRESERQFQYVDQLLK